MYALIIAIHTVFFTITYLLGYTLLAGIFILLWIFFLFYFSPLFFIDHDSEREISSWMGSFTWFFQDFSPQKSILLPIILLYMAFYGFLFSIFGSRENILFLHSLIIIGPYILGIGYMLAFSWKEKVFFDIFRFHTFFTLISVIIITFITFFIPLSPTILLVFISLFWVGAATFFLSVQTHENPVFIYIYLLGGLSFIFQVLQSVFGNISYFLLISVYILGSLLAFEFSPKINLYKPYTLPIRYFSLFLTIILTPVLYYTTFSFLSESVILLSLLICFFLSIHARYGNQVVYILGLLTIYFVYSVLFFWLLQSGSIFSVIIFLFFLPFVLIGITYFIEESHEYDFTILHYSSIGFSVLFSLYTLFFIGWGTDLLFLLSLCIFWVALLFFMSYFYFYNHQKVR